MEDRLSIPLDVDEDALPLIKDADVEEQPPPATLVLLYMGLDCDNALLSFLLNFARLF